MGRIVRRETLLKASRSFPSRIFVTIITSSTRDIVLDEI